MKQIIRTVAFLGLLAMTTTSCQKEDYFSQNIENDQMGSSVHYLVDGVSYSVNLFDRSGWESLLDNLFALVKEGYQIELKANTNNFLKYTDIVTFTTTDENEAKNWASDMFSKGYDVSISIKAGTYVCIARK